MCVRLSRGIQEEVEDKVRGLLEDAVKIYHPVRLGSTARAQGCMNA